MSDGPPAGYHEVPADSGGPPVGYHEVAPSQSAAAPATLGNTQTTSTGIQVPQGMIGGTLHDYIQKILSPSATGVIPGLARGVSNTVGFAKQVGSDLTNPNMPVAIPNQPGGDSMLQHYVVAPAAQEKQRSLEEAQAARDTSGWESVGHGASSMVHTAGEFIPGIGPIIGSLVDRASRGDITGALAEGATYYAAPKLAKGATNVAIDLPKEVLNFTRRAKTIPAIQDAGSMIWKNEVRDNLVKLQAAAEAKGAAVIKEAIDADKAAQTIQGRGTISTANAITALSAVPGAPDTTALTNMLAGNDSLSLEDAKELRTKVGRARNKALSNPVQEAAHTAVYDALGEVMKNRIGELTGGDTSPFDEYNGHFKTSFAIEKNWIKPYVEGVGTATDLITPGGGKLRSFSNAALNDLKENAKRYDMDPSVFDTAQKNAKANAAAYDSVNGKWAGGLMRIGMAGGVAGLFTLGSAMIAKGMGVGGFAPIILAAYLGGKIKGFGPMMEMGETLRKYGIDPASPKLTKMVQQMGFKPLDAANVRDAARLEPLAPKENTATYLPSDQVFTGAPGATPSGLTPQVKADVLSALKNLKWKDADAQRAVQNAIGNDFDSVFRSAINSKK